MASDESGRLPGNAFSRIKPEIFKTSDGKVIVADELLNFIVVKMRTMSHDEIVLLVTNSFCTERIEASKKVLFEVCPNTSQRNVSHKGAQKDTNNVKLCLKVLNECGDNVPRFVSHFLDDLPPVSFNHIDAAALLTRIEQLNNELRCMKTSIEKQTSVCEDLRAVSVSMDSRVSALEKQGGHSESYTGAMPLTSGGTTDGEAEPPARTSPCVSGPVQPPPLSPAWSVVVRDGRPRAVDVKAVSILKPHRSGKASALRRERKTPGIVGTGAVSNIHAVKTKLVSVFATKFDPRLEADALSAYLKENLGRDVKCRKIETAHGRFSSFHITAECNEVADMYVPELWPAGVFVRRYYESRRGKGQDTAGLAPERGRTGISASGNGTSEQ